MTRAKMPELPPAASLALAHFERDLERAHTAQDGRRRASALDAIAQAKAVLRPAEWAALDLHFIRRQSIADIARKGKVTAERVRELIGTAAGALAHHYEAAGAE